MVDTAQEQQNLAFRWRNIIEEGRLSQLNTPSDSRLLLSERVHVSDGMRGYGLDRSELKYFLPPSSNISRVDALRENKAQSLMRTIDQLAEYYKDAPEIDFKSIVQNALKLAYSQFTAGDKADVYVRTLQNIEKSLKPYYRSFEEPKKESGKTPVVEVLTAEKVIASLKEFENKNVVEHGFNFTTSRMVASAPEGKIEDNQKALLVMQETIAAVEKSCGSNPAENARRSQQLLCAADRMTSRSIPENLKATPLQIAEEFKANVELLLKGGKERTPGAAPVKFELPQLPQQTVDHLLERLNRAVTTPAHMNKQAARENMARNIDTLIGYYSKMNDGAPMLEMLNKLKAVVTDPKPHTDVFMSADVSSLARQLRDELLGLAS